MNENLKALIQLTDKTLYKEEKQERFLSRVYFGMVAFVVVIVLLLIFGIVSVVNAKPLEKRIWQSDPQQRFHQSEKR